MGKRRFRLNFIKKRDGLNFRRRRKKFNWVRLRKFVVTLVELVIVIYLAYSLVINFGKQIMCSNISMEPTYMSGDKLLINTVTYRFNEPEIGDVIAFKPKANVNASYSIKRIIAGPGDTVLISKGRLYVNGEKNDPVRVDAIENAGIASSEIVLQEDQYFVLGDNRNASEDSRYESVGFVSINDILGKVWAKYPF